MIIVFKPIDYQCEADFERLSPSRRDAKNATPTPSLADSTARRDITEGSHSQIEIPRQGLLFGNVTRMLHSLNLS